MAVAKHLSFGKAAKELFLTQQCVSDHIKRLEQNHGVLLFERKPHLNLTVAGEALLHSLRKISIIENSLTREINEIKSGHTGVLRFGIFPMRARVIIPMITKQYRDEFPNVELHVQDGETETLTEFLMNEEIDLFLGINCRRIAEFDYDFMLNEPIRLVVSSKLLNDAFGDETPEIVEQFLQHGADISKLEALPFIFYPASSRLQSMITEFLENQSIHIKPAIISGDHSVNATLATQNVGCCFCGEIMLHDTYRWNKTCKCSDYVHIFPIKGFQQTLRQDIVYIKDTYMPHFMKRFCQILKEQMTAKLSHPYGG
jgi:DNA-binding transcriptional LysR family regulator